MTESRHASTESADSEYVPIEDYGIVGNLETCALVAPNGSVDWFPFPHLESPSVHTAILDRDRGGRFRIAPVQGSAGRQEYVGRTNVLETSFRAVNGDLTVTDFMPPAGKVGHPKRALCRKVTCESGTVDVAVEFDPQFDYGRAETTLTATDEGVRATGDDTELLLSSPPALDVAGGRATGELSLASGETAWFTLRSGDVDELDLDPESALADTVTYWNQWVYRGEPGVNDRVFDGPWHEHVVRSGLVLKLLTHVRTGAIAAAPTTSLPEDIGGVRNWDYRYNWLRDAGFTAQALSNLGYLEEAADYVHWSLDLCKRSDPADIQPLYTLHGESDIEEYELEHLDGYRGSRPVRIGNGAADQTQLDIYGEILLAVDEMLRHGELADENWAAIRRLVEYVCEVWDDTGAGIWEVRGGEKHFVYSKVMCWVALDRGIEIAVERGHDAPVDEWRGCREAIRNDVLENGYDEDVGAFVQAYGTNAVDATALLFPIVGFLPFDDDRIQNTIDVIDDRLVEDDVFVQRYDGTDGLPGDEGAFLLCSCWLVDALTLSGRVDEAVEQFERLLEYVSPLGLFAEEIDSVSGTHLGNYPQAFSHIGIINSALYIGYMHGHETPGPAPMGIRLGDPVGVDES